jgi:hypothetical protein
VKSRRKLFETMIEISINVCQGTERGVEGREYASIILGEF